MPSSVGSIIESQILHTTTTRTLHAHSFARSSTQATRVLTGALSRYLTLLAGTCARYAQHAGRTGVTVRDALAALEEIGVGIEELREYAEGEARELLRYTAQTARRAEELTEIGAGLKEGVKHESSDAIQLVYAPVPEDLHELHSDDEEAKARSDFPQTIDEASRRVYEKEEMAFEPPRVGDLYSDIITPPSSPHPLSLMHARKRARTSNWKPPEYIPEFFPAFPGRASSPQRSPSNQLAALPPESNEVVLSAPAPVPATSPSAVKVEAQLVQDSQRQYLPPRPPSPVVQMSSSSSYVASIPYEHSSLASVPTWHLPNPPSEISPPMSSSTLPALLSSHSYLQSSSLSAPSLQTPNPSRHGLAMMLLGLSSRAYSPAATLFASDTTNTSAPLPRRVAPLATHAVPLDKHGRASFALGVERGKLPVPPVDWHARTVSSPVAIVDSTSTQGSRVTTLARMVLPPSIISRATRLLPPPPLERNNQKLLYGPPVPAPWNSSSGASEGRGGKSGKEKDDEDEEEDRVLSDAHLFATWDYDPKDWGSGLVPRRGSKMGFVGGNGVTPGVKRKRSDSMMVMRRGSEAGATMKIKTER